MSDQNRRRLRNILNGVPIVLLLVAVVVLLGCAVSGDSKSPIPLHGNFCGPNYPALHSTSPEDELRQLAAIQPFDTVDWACKEHDMCYTRGGYFARDCDEKLTIRMVLIGNAVHDTACSNLTATIILTIGASYSIASMSHTATTIDMVQNGNLLQKLGGIIMAAPSVAVDGLSSFQDGMNSLPLLGNYATSLALATVDSKDGRRVASLRTPCNPADLPIVQNGVLLGDNCVLVLGVEGAETNKPVTCFMRAGFRVAVPGGKTHYDSMMRH